MVLIRLMLALTIVLAPLAAGAVELTPSERRYLAEHGPFAFCVDPDWAPYEVIDAEGNHAGIAADLLRLAAERAGVELQLVKTATWDETLEAARGGRCDILSFLNQSPSRDEWLLFTDPLFIDRNVIVAREDHPFVADLTAVVGETLALPSGTSIEERVRRDFPALKVVTADSEAEVFAMVSERRADMAMRSLSVAVHTIKKGGWFNLKIAGQVPGYENRLRIGVLKTLPILRDILNRGVATITLAEREEIANRHVSITVQSAVDYDLIIRIVTAFSLVLFTSLVWAVKLRGVNKRLYALSRTDTLTGLANRASLNERLADEWNRFQRHGRALSLILLDLDHFKTVNDELGHLAGDTVLTGFAQLARATLRAEDMAGRWGGEEFLVICPETEGPQAKALAERLCQAMRSHDFATGRRHTVSAGIATMRPGDSLDALISRADTALYAAKDSGRDRAVLE